MFFDFSKTILKNKKQINPKFMDTRHPLYREIYHKYLLINSLELGIIYQIDKISQTQ